MRAYANELGTVNMRVTKVHLSTQKETPAPFSSRVGSHLLGSAGSWCRSGIRGEDRDPDLCPGTFVDEEVFRELGANDWWNERPTASHVPGHLSAAKSRLLGGKSQGFSLFKKMSYLPT